MSFFKGFIYQCTIVNIPCSGRRGGIRSPKQYRIVYRRIVCVGVYVCVVLRTDADVQRAAAAGAPLAVVPARSLRHEHHICCAGDDDMVTRVLLDSGYFDIPGFVNFFLLCVDV